MTRTTLLAVLLAASAACAHGVGELRARRLEAALDATRLDGPLDEAWDAVRRLLAERGFQLGGQDAEAVGQERYGPLADAVSTARPTAPTPRGGRLLETAWGRGARRYVAEAVPDGDGWRVRLDEIREDPFRPMRDGARRRDAELELELLRRLAPAAAAALLARVEGEAKP
jgi:hypothetical protein